MSENETEQAVQEETSESEPQAKSPKLLIIILLAVVLAGGGFFGFKVMGASKPPQASRKVGAVLPMSEFIVNLADADMWLKVELALGIEDGKELHVGGGGDGHAPAGAPGDIPQFRDAIITILTSKSFKDVSSAEGKQRLKGEILSSLNKIAAGHDSTSEENHATADNTTDSPEKNQQGESKEGHAGPVLEVYFTSFATQRN